MLKALALLTSLAAMALVLTVIFAHAQNAPSDPSPFGALTQSDVATVVEVASGVGALQACAVKHMDPKYELTGKAIFFNVFGPFFEPHYMKPTPMGQLADVAISVKNAAWTSGTWLTTAWDPQKKQWVPTYHGTGTKAECDQIEAAVRVLVTAEGNPFGYGPELLPYEEKKA